MNYILKIFIINYGGENRFLINFLTSHNYKIYTVLSIQKNNGLYFHKK